MIEQHKSLMTLKTSARVGSCKVELEIVNFGIGGSFLDVTHAVHGCIKLASMWTVDSGVSAVSGLEPWRFLCCSCVSLPWSGKRHI